MPVKAIPAGYTAVTPYLMVEDAGKLIDFAKKAFGAKETERHEGPDGAVMHAEIRIGGAVIMLADANARSQATQCGLYLYLEDVDAVYEKALAAGASKLMKPADMFYGDRMGGVKDPFGNVWWLATHKEEVSPAEMKKRAEAFNKKAAAAS